MDIGAVMDGLGELEKTWTTSDGQSVSAAFSGPVEQLDARSMPGCVNTWKSCRFVSISASDLSVTEHTIEVLLLVIEATAERDLRAVYKLAWPWVAAVRNGLAAHLELAGFAPQPAAGTLWVLPGDVAIEIVDWGGTPYLALRFTVKATEAEVVTVGA